MVKRHSWPRAFLIYLAMGLVLLFFLGPILWFLALALRPSATAFVTPPQFFFRPQLDAFVYTLINPGTNARQLLNSVIVAGGATLLNIPFALPAAYALSRYRLRAKKQIMLWYIGLLMAPKSGRELRENLRDRLRRVPEDINDTMNPIGRDPLGTGANKAY